MTAWTQKKHLTKYKPQVGKKFEDVFYAKSQIEGTHPQIIAIDEVEDYTIESSNTSPLGVRGLGVNISLTEQANQMAQQLSERYVGGMMVASPPENFRFETAPQLSDAQWANEFIRRSGSYGIQQFPNPIIRHTHPEIKLGVIEFIADHIEIGNNAFEIKVVANNEIYQMFVNDDNIKRELILKWFHRGMMDVDWCYVKTLVYDGEYLTIKGEIMDYVMKKIDETLDEFIPLTKKELRFVYDQLNYQIYL